MSHNSTNRHPVSGREGGTTGGTASSTHEQSPSDDPEPREGNVRVNRNREVLGVKHEVTQKKPQHIEN